MGWLQLAATLAKIVNGILGMIDRRQIMNAGAAENIIKAVEAIHAETEKARASIAAIRDNPAWAERLRKLADRDR